MNIVKKHWKKGLAVATEMSAHMVVSSLLNTYTPEQHKLYKRVARRLGIFAVSNLVSVKAEERMMQSIESGIQQYKTANKESAYNGNRV